MRLDIPGVNGSLGQCVVCGDTFLTEIMMGQKVPMLDMEGFGRKLPVHAKCVDLIKDAQKHGETGWQHLPEGPLRQEFANHAGGLR